MSEANYGLSVEGKAAAGARGSIALDRRRVVIGTATSCDVRLEGEGVSPIHAIMELNAAAGTATVYDLASETGVKVNGQAVIQADVKPGDRIQIGVCELVFRRAEELRPDAPPATEGPGDRSPFLLEEGENVHEIFDYRPEAKKCLEAVMIYVNTILDVSHFTKPKKVMIGPKASDDFGVPPLLGVNAPPRYELVSFVSGQHTLNLHDGMDGVVSVGGKLTPVKQICSDASRSKVLNFGEGDFAKLRLGDVSFFLQFSPSPPKLRRQRLWQRDPLFARIWFLSLATTLMLVTTFSRMTVNPVIEIEQLPERIATIIYKPELLPVERPKPQPKPVEKTPEPKKVTPPPPKKEVIKVTPKPVTTPKPKDAMIGRAEPKKPQPKRQAAPKPAAPKAPPKPAAKAAGNEGAGARAAGDNGTRGKPDSKRSGTPQTKAQRPGTGPKNAPASARPGNSQVQDLGVVDVFKSAGGTLQKIMAGGKGVGGAADKLEGYGGFTTRGAGGLGDAGSGAGGGGKSMGLGGLSDKGVGGGRKGTGLGALGSGGNIIGGKGKLIIAGGNGAPEPIVLGAIDTDAIAREIAKHRDEIKYCYEKEINAENPDLQGRVSIHWVIGASGDVSSAGVASTTLRNAAVEGCVVAVIKRIAFPPVKGGGIAEVTYPFLFRPASQ